MIDILFHSHLVSVEGTPMLHILDKFEEWNRLPKTLSAKYIAGDGHQWWLTLVLHFNKEAEKQGVECVENQIYATKGLKSRRQTVMGLFKHAVEFSRIPFHDNTVTRVRLQTNVHGLTSQASATLSASNSLRHPIQQYMGISLERLECFVDEDDTSAIRYPSVEALRTEYPLARFINLEDLSGIGHNESELHRGVYKVLDTIHNVWCVYKEPTSPADVKSQLNEIKSLMLLSNSPHIIPLLGLVISHNPYLSYPDNHSPLVVRGILLKYASNGTLGRLLESDSLHWHQCLLWAKQIALGLLEIHTAGMFHMDMKSSNVVIDDFYNALIIDFGRRGSTYGWNAPETYVDKDQSEPSLEVMQHADIYSFGVVLWEILTRQEVDIPIGVDHADFFKS
jgi:serine/threonine protein kinase